MRFKWIGVEASDTQSMGIVNLENRRALRELGWEDVEDPKDADVVISFMHQGDSRPDTSGRTRIFYLCSTSHNSLVKEFANNYREIAESRNNYIFVANHDMQGVFERAGIRTHVWNHGVDLSMFRHVDKGPDGLVFGFVGQGAPFKRHRLVVDAFLGAFTDDPKEAKLRLVTGWDSVEGYHDIPENVELIHTVRRKDMPDFYGSISCLVNFSYGETCNMTLLEGLACGVPCIVTDMPSMHEDVYETRLRRVRSRRIIKPSLFLGASFAPRNAAAYIEPPWLYEVDVQDATEAMLDFEGVPWREPPLPPRVSWEARILDQVIPVLEVRQG